jgi:hypothetical protein
MTPEFFFLFWRISYSWFPWSSNNVGCNLLLTSCPSQHCALPFNTLVNVASHHSEWCSSNQVMSSSRLRYWRRHCVVIKAALLLRLHLHWRQPHVVVNVALLEASSCCCWGDVIIEVALLEVCVVEGGVVLPASSRNNMHTPEFFFLFWRISYSQFMFMTPEFFFLFWRISHSQFTFMIFKE